MTTILKREGDTVQVGNHTFEIAPSYSAVGLLGQLACPVYDNEKLDPPYIIGVDGIKRPMIIRFGDGHVKKEKIDMRILFDVKDAEKRRWRKIQHMHNTVIPTWNAAFAAVKKAKLAHHRTKSGVIAYKYETTYGYNGGSVSYNWLDDDKVPKKLRNTTIGAEFYKTDDYLQAWWSRISIWNEIFHRSLMNTLPKEVRYPHLKDRPEVAGIVVFVINGRDYVYQYMENEHRVWELQRYAFPNLWSGKPIEKIEIK